MGITVPIEGGGELHIEKPHLAVSTGLPLSTQVKLLHDQNLLPRLILSRLDGNVYFVTKSGQVFIRTKVSGRREIFDWTFKPLETIDWIFDR